MYFLHVWISHQFSTRTCPINWDLCVVCYGMMNYVPRVEDYQTLRVTYCINRNFSMNLWVATSSSTTVDIYNITLSHDADLLSQQLCSVSLFDLYSAKSNNGQGKTLNTQKNQSIQQQKKRPLSNYTKSLKYRITLSYYYQINTNTLNAELSPICHLLALLGVHHILHVSRIRVKRKELIIWIYSAKNARTQ